MQHTHASHVAPVVVDALRAANSHDPAAFTDCFAVDAEVDGWGRRLVGRAAVQRWIVDIIVKDRIAMTDFIYGIEDGDVLVHAQVSRMGRTEPATFVFAVQDGLVRRLTVAP